ncbi:MAG: hypothetical protein FI698_04220 [SAR202 cluster bacterium]|nr:hypothetical protein [SAR202 cluster bacterium]|tara:strand:- start:46336 stop:46776 length:441 start_codon:yes stop_codon:yes gene_type:complete
MKKLSKSKLDFDEDLENIKYSIDLNNDSHRSVALIIADRRDYAIKQSGNMQDVLSSNLKDLVKEISVQAIDSQEYLLPDMPLKEAVFRTVLANKNKPISPVAISQKLKSSWPVNTYPRDISPKVIQSLLENMKEYPVKKVVPNDSD